LAWKRDEVALRRFVEAALWICRTGAPWRDLPEALGFMVQRLPSLVPTRLVGAGLRGAPPEPARCCSTAPHARPHRASSGAAGSTAAEALGRSRGGLCSKLHACADSAGRVLQLIASPGQHSDLCYATALASGIPACDAALDRGYISAPLRASFAARGCTVHTPPRHGMVDPPD
jgi:transposase